MVVEKTPEVHRIAIPFLDDPGLYEQYVNFDGHLRFGKVMEDLDAFACNVAFRHADDEREETRPVHVVTAAVDEIVVHRGVEQLIRFNLDMEGVVTWVGRSSIEVECTAFADGEPAVTATFLLVGKDSGTGKTTQVNRLKPTTDVEVARWNAGAMRNDRRREERKTDLFAVSPREDETAMLHKLMLQVTGASDSHPGAPAAPPEADSHPGAGDPTEPLRLPPIDMPDTRMWTYQLCQPQQRNTANNIFGGYLMRVGFELARANAYAFCNPTARALGENTMPMLLDVNDISFASPVKIGNLLDLSSRVVYSSGGAFQVRLEIRAQDMNNNASPKPTVTTNVLHFTFACALASANDFGRPLPVQEVKPTNYRQGLLLLDGRRRMMAAAANGNSKMRSMLPDSFEI